MSELSELSVEELEQESYRLDEEKQAIRARQHNVQVALGEANAKVSAARTVAALSAPEKDALAQAIAAEGIESAEAAGAPDA